MLKATEPATMKVTLQTWFGLAFKGFLAVLFALLMWCLWIAVQPGNNSAPAAGVTASREAWFSFGLDRISALQHAPFGNIPLWQYVASLIYTFLAFLLARLIDSFIGHRARQWAAKTATKLDDLLLDLIRGPLKVVVFIVLLHFGLEMYAWPPALAKLLAKTSRSSSPSASLTWPSTPLTCWSASGNDAHPRPTTIRSARTCCRSSGKL